MRMTIRHEMRATEVVFSPRSCLKPIAISRDRSGYTWRFRDRSYTADRWLSTLLCDGDTAAKRGEWRGLPVLGRMEFDSSQLGLLSWRGDGCNRIRIDRQQCGQRSTIARRFERVCPVYCFSKHRVDAIPDILFMHLCFASQTG